MLIYFGVFVKDFFVVLFFVVGIAGDRPPRYGVIDLFYHRRTRACPSPCCGLPEDRGGNPLGCADGIRGPRATIIEARAGDKPPRYGK